MKLSLKNLLIILGVLLVVFFIVQFTKSDGRSKSLRSELVSIDTTKTTKVEISSPKGAVTLTKAGDDWTVTLANGAKKAKESTVKSLFQTLNMIEPSRLASRKKENWKDYEVDSMGTRVKVFAGDKVTTDIVLGRFGVEGQRSFYSFVRLFEDENVYVANGFMKMSVYENADDYRDNNVLRLKKDSLTQVVFDYPEGSFTLEKNTDWTIGGAKADSATVAEFFQGLSYANSKNFYEETATVNYTHAVTFSFSNSSDIKLEGLRENDDVIVKSSENAVEIFNDADLWDKIFKDPVVFAATLQ